MKINIALATIALVGCGIGFSGAVFAQACTANGSTVFSGANTATPNTVAGNSCGHNASQSTLCGGAEALNGAGVDIYQVTLGASNNFTFSATTAAFTPWIALIGGACASITACPVDQTIAAAGTVNSGAIPAQAAGTYFIAVGDVSADAPGCGAYSLTVNPTLPVQLQGFSVN